MFFFSITENSKIHVQTRRWCLCECSCSHEFLEEPGGHVRKSLRGPRIHFGQGLRTREQTDTSHKVSLHLQNVYKSADKLRDFFSPFRSTPRRAPRGKRRIRFAKKWWCPHYMFNGREYPQMVSGAGYLMTSGAAECVYREVLKLPFFHLEDVLLTGFARQVSLSQRSKSRISGGKRTQTCIIKTK